MLEIEIFSDAICPVLYWQATAARYAEHEFDPEVRLRWRPYLLYPNLPIEGIDDGLRALWSPWRLPGAQSVETSCDMN